MPLLNLSWLPTPTFFRYNVTRPYPFPWFAPVAMVGGLVFTVLFSVLNYALNGFDMVSVEYPEPQTGNPDATWYERFAALQTNSMQANCSPVQFPVNSQFFTNQSGLTYTLSAIWNSETGNSKDYQPLLSYYDEPLEDCFVSLLQVDIEEMDRTGAQVAGAGWGAVARAYVTCSLKHTGGGTTNINLTTSYEAVGPTFSELVGPQQFVATNQHLRASLWWGESLLSARWANLSQTLSNTWPAENEIPPRKWLTQSLRNDSILSILDADFFNLWYNIYYDQSTTTTAGNITNAVLTSPVPASGAIAGIEDGEVGVYNGAPILSGVDSLGKILYSAVMVDLGQVKQPTASNMLLDAEALQSFSSEVQFVQQAGVSYIPGPATADYETLRDKTGNLTTTPSVISTIYTCQIPKRKPIGSLILSILIADLVFLQAAWTFYGFVSGLFVKDKHYPNYCEGCLKLAAMRNENVLLGDIESPRTSRPHSSRLVSSSSGTQLLLHSGHYRSVSPSGPLD